MILISRFYMILCVIIFLTINVIITQSQFIEPTIDILDDGNIYNNNNIMNISGQDGTGNQGSQFTAADGMVFAGTITFQAS